MSATRKQGEIGHGHWSGRSRLPSVTSTTGDRDWRLSVVQGWYPVTVSITRIRETRRCTHDPRHQTQPPRDAAELRHIGYPIRSCARYVHRRAAQHGPRVRCMGGGRAWATRGAAWLGAPERPPSLCGRISGEGRGPPVARIWGRARVPGAAWGPIRLDALALAAPRNELLVPTLQRLLSRELDTFAKEIGKRRGGV